MTTEQAIQTLNEAFVSDAEAIDKLIKTRVKCNEELAGHPTIQVTENNELGVLGLINGILEESGQKKVAMELDDDTEQLLGFSEFKE